MANEENLKGHGFQDKTASERRELAIKAGKASGKARRKQADFRKTLNALLTAKVDNPKWTPMLEAMGFDSTMESVINAAMIMEAANGDVNAYKAIRDTIGQESRTELELAEQKLKVELLKKELEAAENELKARQDQRTSGGSLVAAWIDKVKIMRNNTHE